METKLDFSAPALQKVREDRLLIERVDTWIYEEVDPYVGQRVLEIGCGHGNFARFFADRQLYIGIDLSAESVEQVQSRFGHLPNVRAQVADVTAEPFLDLARHRLDSVFSLNVFEHIQDDLGALRNAKQVIVPGGTLVLVVPAHSWLFGTIDVAIGHYRRYDKRALAAMFRELDLELLVHKYLNMAGALGWFTSGRLFRHTVPPSGQLRLFNRLVPLLKRIERTISAPFGVSIMAVGRKK